VAAAPDDGCELVLLYEAVDSVALGDVDVGFDDKVEAAAAFWAFERDAPLTPPVGDVLAI